jgi:hypothetical protein
MNKSCDQCLYSRKRRIEQCYDCCNDDIDMYANFTPNTAADHLIITKERWDAWIAAVEKHRDSMEKLVLCFPRYHGRTMVKKTYEDLCKALDDLGLNKGGKQ